MQLRLKRARRVRVHLIEDGLPSIEGLLVGKGRHGREVVVALPQLITEAVTQGGAPTVLDSRYVAIPRERVAFWEPA